MDSVLIAFWTVYSVPLIYSIPRMFTHRDQFFGGAEFLDFQSAIASTGVTQMGVQHAHGSGILYFIRFFFS